MGRLNLGGARLSQRVSSSEKQATGPPLEIEDSILFNTASSNFRDMPICLHFPAARFAKLSSSCRWSSSNTNAVRQRKYTEQRVTEGARHTYQVYLSALRSEEQPSTVSESERAVYPQDVCCCRHSSNNMQVKASSRYVYL